MWGDIVIAFLIAFLASFMATPHTIKLARKLGAVDTPKDDRRINKVTMPRLGGLAVILGFVLSTLYLLISLSVESNINLEDNNMISKLIGFLIGGIIIGVVCFIDDVKGVHAIIKLIAQIAAAGVVIASGLIIDTFEVPYIYKSEIWDVFNVILTMVWIVGITNAMNLIDGLDGLSTGISIISSLSLLIIFSLNGSPLISVVLITALGGALCGFLPFNFNPAKTFIGDTGSNFLGYSLSIISILGIAKTYTAIVIVAPLLVLALPICDTLWAIVRRIIKGKNLKAIFEPDTGHLHHKMLKKGFTQKQAVLILYGLSAIFGMFAIILLESGIWKAISFAIIVILIIACGYKEFFKQKLIGSLVESEDNLDEIRYDEKKIRHDK